MLSSLGIFKISHQKRSVYVSPCSIEMMAVYFPSWGNGPSANGTSSEKAFFIYNAIRYSQYVIYCPTYFENRNKSAWNGE